MDAKTKIEYTESRWSRFSSEELSIVRAAMDSRISELGEDNSQAEASVMDEISNELDDRDAALGLAGVGE